MDGKAKIQFTETDFMTPNDIIYIFLIFEDLWKAWSVSPEKGNSAHPKFIEHFRDHGSGLTQIPESDYRLVMCAPMTRP